MSIDGTLAASVISQAEGVKGISTISIVHAFYTRSPITTRMETLYMCALDIIITSNTKEI